MTPTDFLYGIIRPGCDRLGQIMSRRMSSPEALVLLLAIAMQESALKHRRQLGSGPARGWWQFEGGNSQALGGIMRLSTTAPAAKAYCAAEFIPFQRLVIHEAIAWHDGLATAFARLLLWTDPMALPAIGDKDGAYAYYLRNWRPGKPRPRAWPKHYAAAAECLDGFPPC